MPKNEVQLVISVDSKKGLKGVKTFAKTATKAFRGVTSALTDIRTLGAVALGVFAGRQLVGALGELTAAAAAQEDAVNALNTALKTSGEFSQEASRQMQDFASSLQATTRFGDETILNQLAIAKAFGATNEQAQKVVEASIELAEAQGKSLDEAVRQVSKSLGGYAGELGEVLPEVKNLTKEQLQNAEVADLLIEKYGGTAAKRVQTFSGASEQLANVIGDLREVLGSVVTENPAVIAAIGGLTKGFQDLIKLATENKQEIASFVTDGLKLLINSLPAVISVAGFVAQALEGIGTGAAVSVVAVADLIRAFLAFENVPEILNYVKDTLLVVGGSATRIAAELTDFASFTAAAIGGKDQLRAYFNAKKAGDDLATTLRELSEITLEGIGDDVVTGLKDNLTEIRETALEGGTETESFFGKLEKGIDGVKASVEKSVAGITAAIDAASGVASQGPDTDQAEDQYGKLSEIIIGFYTDAKTATVEFYESLKTGASSAIESVKSAFSGDIVAKIDAEAGQLAGNIGASIKESIENLTFDNIASAISTGASVLQGALSGSFIQGVADFGKQILEFPKLFREALRNLSEILREIVAQFPQLVEDLVNNFPTLINDIVKSIPKVVQALADGMPKILISFAKGVPLIVEALAKNLPTLIDALLDALPEVIDTFLEAMPDVILAIAEGIPQIVQSLAENLPAIIEVLAENMAPITEALTYGIISTMPQVVATLVDELIIKGGALRIAIAIIKGLAGSIVGVARGFASGVVEGLKNFTFTKPEWVKNIEDGLTSIARPDWLKRLKIRTPGWLKDFTRAVNRLTDWEIPGTSGGGGGLVSGTGTVLDQLAGGELVTQPKVALVGEAGPELVVRAGTTERLFDLIDQLASGQGPGSGDQMAMLAAIMEQLAQPMTVQTTAEVNGESLADIILQLSRQNARTAA